MSPVASSRASWSATSDSAARSTYLDEDAVALDSAERGLALCDDDDFAPAERLRILAEVGHFLDELFQLTGRSRPAAAVPRPSDEFRRRVEQLVRRQREVLDRLRSPLAEAGLALCWWSELSHDDHRIAATVFRDRLRPVLVPLVAEPGKPWPPAANLSLNLAVVARHADGRRRLGSVELPPVVPRFIRLRPPPGTGGVRVVPVEQVVEAHLAELFPDHTVEASAAFRVTRQAGVVIGPDVDDLLASVERQLRLERHGAAVRLEVESRIPADVLDRLVGDLGVGPDQVYPACGLLGLADLTAVAPSEGSGATPARPAVPARLRSESRPGRDPFELLDAADVLVHFPYDSYADSVVALLDQASADPGLLAIKQTLYRPSPDGPTVRALARAAERGSHVVAVVELGARLDERSSIASARALDRAGAHVVYGLVGLRTHSSLTLVIRDGGEGLSRYGVVGTGLHHPTRRPEGLALLTADADITADLTDLFNYLTGYSRPARFRKVLVGPGHLRSRLLESIRRETAAGPAGRIALKVCRLLDREVIDALYRASQRGTRVDVVVAGACALCPGVPGLSEAIRVVAPLGRHFDSSRLFGFGTGEDASWFLSSGDLTASHLDRQVDIAVPVEQPAHRARLEATLDAMVRLPAWEMDAAGDWHRRGRGADDVLLHLAASAGSSPAARAGLPR